MFCKYKHFLIIVVALSAYINSFAQTYRSQTDSIGLNTNGVVNIGYGVQEATYVTSSVATVEGSELRKPFVSNLGNTLYGRLPGLMVVQQGNEPGNDSPGMYVRGLNTFGGAGTAPLIIVDGVESSFEQMVPYEIESITLLKDASATAIFGSRGANGVLLVTTKRGRNGALKIDVTAQLGFQQAMRMPRFLDSYDYARLYNEGLKNDGSAPLYSAEELEKYRTHSNPYLYPDVDWYEQVLRTTAPISNFNMSFSGGDNSVKYFASLNRTSSGGLYRKSGNMSENSLNAEYDRYNIRANVDIQLSSRVSTSLDLGGSIGEKSTPFANTTDAMFSKLSILRPNAFPIYNPDGSYGGNSLYTNPLGDILESGFYTSSSRIFQSSFRLNGDLDMIMPGLTVSAGLSYHTFFESYSNKTREYERFDISESDLGEIVYTRYGQNTQLEGNEDESDQWQNLTFQTFFNYKKEIGAYKFDAMVMYNYKHFTIIGPSEYYPNEGSVFPYEHVGVGGRFTNTWKGKYIGELSFGYYGSENFAEGNRFGFFPAGSLGWIISEEDFFDWSGAFDFLKLRGSFGIVGNDNVGGDRFMFEPGFPNSAGYFFGGSNTYHEGIVQGRPVNPGFTWEKEKEFNIGVDATLFDRFDVKLDYFNQERYDILVPAYAEIPAFLGLEYSYVNVGKVSSQGFETALSFTSDQSKELIYFASVNLWYTKNQIKYNSEKPQNEAYLYQTGRLVDQPFLLEAIGFFEDEDDIEDSPRQVFTEVQPGDIKYKDQNGDDVIDNSDFYPFGKSNVPQFNLGLNSGISYKAFYLDFLLQGVTGRSVYLNGSYYHAFQNDAQVSSVAFGRWTPENKEGATYPRLSASDNENNFQPSTFWQRDGSFIKLRSLEIGYHFPKSAIEKLGLDKVHVFVNGSNLFSIDNLEYSDPETLYGYPAMRTISMGTSIQF